MTRVLLCTYICIPCDWGDAVTADILYDRSDSVYIDIFCDGGGAVCIGILCDRVVMYFWHTM